MRDIQKQAVYDAEHSVEATVDFAKSTPSRTVKIHNSTINAPDEMLFGALSTVETYCNRILRTSWCVAAFGDRSPVTVRERKTDHKAHYQMGVISIHTQGTCWAMRELVVLHELAHHLARGDQHGPEFTGAFLFLVRNVLGWEAELLLSSAYHSHGVKVTLVKERGTS